MPTFYWNLDSGLVTSQPYGTSAVQFEAARGGIDVRLILMQGTSPALPTPVLLDSLQTLVLILRDKDALDLGAFAGPVNLTRGATAADGYIGSVSTDTEIVRKLMRVGDPQNTELASYPLDGAFYRLPTSGNAVESTPFPWTITPNFFRPGTPPAEIIASWSSPAQLSAAIAAAASAQPRLPTPTANGQFLFGNVDGSTSWGALPTNLSPTFINVAATTFSGDGSALTNLSATAITGTIALANLPAAIQGALHYRGTWNAATNSPTINSGTGELGGYYVVNVSGTTTVDGVNVWTAGDHIVFDGTKWDKLDGAANPVSSVDGQTGAVVLATDAAAGTGSKRTLGTGASQAAPGNDTRFPASVSGIRMSAGAGSTDTAAVAGVHFLTPTGSGAGLTNVAPVHPVVWSQNGGSGPAPYFNNTAISFGGSSTTGASVAEWTTGSNGIPARRISDLCGSFGVTVSGFGTSAAGLAAMYPILLAEITFNTPYPTSIESYYSFTSTPPRGQPGIARVNLRLGYNSSNLLPFNGQPTPSQASSVAFMYVFTTGSLKIYLVGAPAQGINPGTSDPYDLNLMVTYEVVLGA